MTERAIGYNYVSQILAGASAHGWSGPGYGQSSLSGCQSIKSLLADHASEIIEGAWIVDGRLVK